MLTERVIIGPDGEAVAAPVWHKRFWEVISDWAAKEGITLTNNEAKAACANRYSNLANISYIVFWESLNNALNENNDTTEQMFIWRSEHDKARFCIAFQ